MLKYTHILVPIDLNRCSRRVLDAAVDIARRHEAALTILHVVEYVPVNAGGDAMLPSTLEVTDDLAEQAKIQLQALEISEDVSVNDRIVVVGRIKSEITDVANRRDVDLIVIGSHERHGLALLVNYTEDTVLHHAPCDVLAIRLKHD